MNGGGEIVDLRRAAASAGDAAPAVPRDVIGFLDAGEAARGAAGVLVEHVASLDDGAAREEGLVLELDDVRLLPAVPRPPKIICIGRNYAEHAKEAGFELSEYPILFPRFAATLVADGEPVERPTVSSELDWEGELAVIIGRGGRHIAKEEAMSHVGGYAAFNDVTVRDYQFKTTQYLAGKNFHASGPFGPYLVTADEVTDPHDLEVRTFIDDEQVQFGRTNDLLFDIPTIISIISEFIELETGDVIPTGTPSGVGFKRKPPRFLQSGETVRVEIPGVGVLRNPVVDEVAV